MWHIGVQLCNMGVCLESKLHWRGAGTPNADIRGSTNSVLVLESMGDFPRLIPASNRALCDLSCMNVGNQPRTLAMDVVKFLISMHNHCALLVMYSLEDITWMYTFLMLLTHKVSASRASARSTRIGFGYHNSVLICMDTCILLVMLSFGL
jgi:hypothetical protein